MHFDVTDLRLFRSVAEAGSITAGGERAGLSLAAASARIKHMEDQAGTPLLERGRRGVDLTAAGQTLLRHARQVLQQIERLRDELGEHARRVKGQVRLAANTAAMAEFLPDLLAEFLFGHPLVNLDLDELSSHEIARALNDERADLGVLADHADLRGLSCRPFRQDRLVLAVPAQHPLAAARSLDFSEALGYDFIGMDRNNALQQHLALQARNSGSQLRLRAQARGLDAICRMVAGGAGIAVIPEAAAARHADEGSLVPVPLTNDWAERRLLLAARGFDGLPRQARELADYLVPPETPPAT